MALLQEPWPGGDGEVAGPPFRVGPDARWTACGRWHGASHRPFDLGPTVDTLDQAAALLSG